MENASYPFRRAIAKESDVLQQSSESTVIAVSLLVVREARGVRDCETWLRMITIRLFVVCCNLAAVVGRDFEARGI